MTLKSLHKKRERLIASLNSNLLGNRKEAARILAELRSVTHTIMGRELMSSARPPEGTAQ